MLYEDLKAIENLLEGNEYSAHGVTYYIAFDKIDSSLPLDLAVKMRFKELDAIPSTETNISMTPIEDLDNELKNLCVNWHVDEKICSKLLSVLDEGVKMYRCCDDSEYISRGNLEDIFRVIENGEERVLIDFYVVD